MEKQTTIYSYPDMAMNGTTSHPIGIDKAIHFDHEGYYISEIFDSGHSGMLWGRLSLEGDFHSILVEIWTADHKEKLLLIQDNDIAPTLRSIYPHVLLKQAQGRYLRFRLCTKRNACLRGFEIIYPYRSHIELLPQMYQEDEDLHLFMAPLEDTFLTLQKEIRQLSKMWSPIVATQEQLLMMATFLRLDCLLNEDIDTLRTLLVHNQKWTRRRGTYEALFFLASVILKRNVLLSVEHDCIYMIATYHNEQETKHIETLLLAQIAFGVSLRSTWIMDVKLDNSYLDIGMQYDRNVDTVLDDAYMGEQIWM